MPQLDNKRLIEQLSASQVYRDYERAFNQATGLPLKLRSVEIWQLAHQYSKYENPFCAILSKQSRSCAACLEVQQKIAESPGLEAKSVKCFAGLCDTAVPVQLGNKLIGFLQTGQVFLKEPTQRQFAKTTKQLLDWGLKVDLGQLEEAYFHSRVLTPKQYESMISLLTIFGQHLSFVCNLFKKATGLNFTEYLSQVRIEKAKNLLLNPNLRVSEIGYEIGFQSLTHFNRVFKHVLNQSPTEYRTQLAAN